MRILMLVMLAAISINLTACSSMRGNVVPQKGPTMEQVYDSMGSSSSSLNGTSYSSTSLNTQDGDQDLKKIRQDNRRSMAMKSSSLPEQVSASAIHREFRELPNPSLKVYIYPHLAGNDEVPVPGYYTVFNGYNQDYYALADGE